MFRPEPTVGTHQHGARINSIVVTATGQTEQDLRSRLLNLMGFFSSTGGSEAAIADAADMCMLIA